MKHIIHVDGRVLCELCESVFFSEAAYFVISEKSVCLHLCFLVLLVGAFCGAIGTSRCRHVAEISMAHATKGRT